ncbi:MAG: hypothetical protein QF632_03230 [Candidatus Woesearchaeota archaeon]|nr:hypothetical protein [Candidatus Woesearchaeota archaeon]
MAILRRGISGEIEKMKRQLHSPSFKVPDNWFWWDKKIAHFNEIVYADVAVVKRIHIFYLHAKEKKKTELTEKILQLARELRKDIDIILQQSAPDARTQKNEAMVVNELIRSLDRLLGKIVYIPDYEIEKNWEAFQPKAIQVINGKYPFYDSSSISFGNPRIPDLPKVVRVDALIVSYNDGGK